MDADRLNLEYRATEDPYHRHRAMQILRPSTELAGRYTCKVSTFNNEESVTSPMVVYGRQHPSHITTSPITLKFPIQLS